MPYRFFKKREGPYPIGDIQHRLGAVYPTNSEWFSHLRDDAAVMEGGLGLNTPRHALPTTALTGILVISAICCAPKLAGAQDSEPNASVTEKKRYDDHIGRAESCFMNEQFDCCAAQFKKAYELSPSPVLLNSIAICLDESKKWLEAVDYYNQYITSIDDVEYQETAKMKVETCLGYLGSLSLTVAPTTAQVFVDGIEIDQLTPLFLYPGNHQLVIEHVDYEPYEEDFAITAGASIRRDVQLEKTKGEIIVYCEDESFHIYVDNHRTKGTCPYTGEFNVGPHHVRVINSKGKEIVSEKIVVRPSYPTSIYIRIPIVAEQQTEPIKSNAAINEKKEIGENWQKFTAYLTMGIGGVALGAILITDQVKFAKARDAVDDAESILKEMEQTEDKEIYRSSQEYTDAHENYYNQKDQYQKWVKHPGRIAAYAIGGTFLLGGGVLFLYSFLKKDPKEKERFSLKPGLGGARICF